MAWNEKGRWTTDISAVADAARKEAARQAQITKEMAAEKARRIAFERKYPLSPKK